MYFVLHCGEINSKKRLTTHLPCRIFLAFLKCLLLLRTCGPVPLIVVYCAAMTFKLIYYSHIHCMTLPNKIPSKFSLDNVMYLTCKKSVISSCVKITVAKVTVMPFAGKVECWFLVSVYLLKVIVNNISWLLGDISPVCCPHSTLQENIFISVLSWHILYQISMHVF